MVNVRRLIAIVSLALAAGLVAPAGTTASAIGTVSADETIRARIHLNPNYDFQGFSVIFRGRVHSAVEKCYQNRKVQLLVPSLPRKDRVVATSKSGYSGAFRVGFVAEDVPPPADRKFAARVQRIKVGGQTCGGSMDVVRISVSRVAPDLYASTR